MRIFLRVVDLGSLSAAADAEGLSPTMVGKHLHQLEERLGVRLLNRTTRRQSLTEAGMVYYDRARAALAEVEAADAAVSKLGSAPRGLLRVTAASLFGVYSLMPVMNVYMQRYPEVKVELHLIDRVIDLVEEGMDVAIRIGKLPDSSLVARPLRPYRLVVCATPAYLAAHGTPDSPEALKLHNCLGFLGAWSQNTWTFRRGDDEFEVGIDGSFKANSVHALHAAAMDDIGIVLLPMMVVEEDLASGRLQEVLPGFASAARPLNIVYPSSRQLTPKLRTFIDCVAEHLG